MANKNKNGHSVQAVSVSTDGSFAVNEEAVRRVVTREEVRGLPVAVVAVAGATRGGKSFLLDFFLRYLHAPAEARENGRWLGAEDEPLQGFSWRGGCERDTTGILIWSEPIIITLDSGEKVAVLLMDTQGTFDSQSTFRESTTIFALSTLLSSTQIYNLSQNIKEDDLEYLQFFTEYGKVASGGGEKPFQVLQFLVRDWPYAYQHPYGTTGGKSLLDVRLQEENCNEELKEVRQQIKTSFETVRCFLMPHPGLEVATSPNFVGCLAGITKEFKKALLDLTSLLFHPKDLVLKNINGETVITEDLFEYLKTYVEMFNSDELPTPVNILKATGEASLEVTASFARKAYHAHIHRATLLRAVARAAVPRLHAAAVKLAEEVFTARKMLVTPERHDQRLQELLLELEASLPQYIILNEDKLHALLAACEAIFEELLQQSSCLTPIEVVETHRKAVEAAMDRFDGVFADDDSEEVDEDRSPLLKKLEDDLSKFEAENAKRIRDLVIDSKALYERVLLRGSSSSSSSGVCIPLRVLQLRHRDASTDATTYFTVQFTSEENAENEHKEQLLQFIETRWSEISMVNATHNNTAVSQALEYYNEEMNELFADSKCLHPSDLQSEHEKILELTIIRFKHSRTVISDDDDNEDDPHLQDLKAKLNTCYSQHRGFNWTKNDEAVEKAHKLYKTLMRIPEGFVGSAIHFMTADMSWIAHGQFSRDAMTAFDNEYRRASNIHHQLDFHRSKLHKNISATYSSLMFKVIGAVGLTALPVTLLGSLIFRR